MKKSVLRAPLIKSAFLLVIFSLLVYYTSTSAEGSIWDSIGMILMSAFTIAQLTVGLILSLALCLVVLCAIFLGSVAMVSKESAASMYQHLLQFLQSSFGFLHIKICTNKAASEEAYKNEINGIITSRLNGIKKSQAEQYLQLRSLSEKIEKLEQGCAVFVSAESLEKLEKEMADSRNINQQIAGDLTRAVATLENHEKQLQQLSSESLLGDLPGKVEALEEQSRRNDTNETLELLKQQLDTISVELAEVKTVTEEAAISIRRQESVPAVAAEENEEITYRLCSYFSNQSDCDKLKQLVSETLGKDMTYAQVSEYVLDNLSKNAVEIVRSHPALMKDYIRQRRKNS